MELIFKAGKLYEFVEEEMFYYFGYIDSDITFQGYWRKGSDIKYDSVSKSKINAWLEYQENTEDNIIERDVNDYPQASKIQEIMIMKIFSGWLI